MISGFDGFDHAPVGHLTEGAYDLIARDELFLAALVCDHDAFGGDALYPAPCPDDHSGLFHTVFQCEAVEIDDVFCNVVLNLDDCGPAAQCRHGFEREVAAGHAAAADDEVTARDQLGMQVGVYDAEDVAAVYTGDLRDERLAAGGDDYPVAGGEDGVVRGEFGVFVDLNAQLGELDPVVLYQLADPYFEFSGGGGVQRAAELVLLEQSELVAFDGTGAGRLHASGAAADDDDVFGSSVLYRRMAFSSPAAGFTAQLSLLR